MQELNESVNECNGDFDHLLGNIEFHKSILTLAVHNLRRWAHNLLQIFIQ